MPGGPVIDEEGLAVQSTGEDELLGIVLLGTSGSIFTDLTVISLLHPLRLAKET
jgi:hypothetical protein